MRGANGRDERFGFGAHSQVLTPTMECFGRHLHDHLPLSRVEIPCFLSPSRVSIPEMGRKCDRFQAFPGAFFIYLGG